MTSVFSYFDTDAFHHFARTYQERPLPEELRGSIVLSTITMLEVLTHLVPESTTFKELQGLPNWMNRGDVHLLPWPEEMIAERVLGIPPKDVSFLQAVEAVLTHCLNGRPDDLFELARSLNDVVKKSKQKRAKDFLPLVELNRSPELENFDDEWLKCVIPQLRNGLRLSGPEPKARLLDALSAYHEFERAKLKLALDNANYSAYKHRNDALDSQQLAYLCDPALHFVTCDKGYLNKIQLSAQRNRIHKTSRETLSDPAKAEALLRDILT